MTSFIYFPLKAFGNSDDYDVCPNQEKAAVSRVEGRLEQEISDLRRRDAELDQLSHTQNHVSFLQETEI